MKSPSDRPRKPGRRVREEVKPGRPRKTADTLRSERIHVRVSPHELALLREEAGGRPLTVWVRALLFGAPRGRLPMIPAANIKIVGQLAKLGNNLNQLVRLAHTGRFPSRLEPLLRDLLQKLAGYQRELLGSPP